MSHCDYDTIFYRVFCATVLGIAFTFTVILTNVFIDIDGLLSKKDGAAEATPNFDSYKTDIKNDVLYDDPGDNADPYRGKRSIEPDNFLFQVKNPNVKKMLTNKLANLLEELDEEETSKRNENVASRKSDTEIISYNNEKKTERDTDNMLHLAMHNILLQGIIGHMDLNNVYKKVHMLVKNFYEHNKTEKPNIDIDRSKEIQEYPRQNEEMKFFEELLKCKTLKEQVNNIKNYSQNNEKEPKIVIKTVIEINDNGKLQKANSSSNNIIGLIKLIYNGKSVKIGKLEDPFLKSGLDDRELIQSIDARKFNQESPNFKAIPLIKEKQLSDPKWNKIIENYLNQYPVSKDYDKNIGNKINRKKRQIKIHYLDGKHATNKPKTAQKIKKDDEELYIEIETHFDGKGIKGEKKKKLVRSLIDKIQRAIHDDGETAMHEKRMFNHIKIKKRNQDPIKAKSSFFYSKIVPAIRDIEHRKLDPIINIQSPIKDVLSNNEERFWNGQLQSQYLPKIPLNAAEMGNLIANYNNEISKREQTPINIGTNGFKDRGDSNVTFYMKDIDGSGFSVGFNQYTDEPPDVESLKLFNGVENIIQEYHNTFDKNDKLSDNINNNQGENYIERQQESISNSHVFRRSVNNDPYLNFSYKKYIKNLIKPLSYYKNRDLNSNLAKIILKHREKDANHSPGTLNIISKPIRINDLSIAFVNNYYNELHKNNITESLENSIPRQKRSVNVRKISNLNSKIKLNRFININPKFNKKVFKGRKRNKRQVKKIRIIARDQSQGKNSNEEGVYIVSPNNVYPKKTEKIPDTDTSDTQNTDSVPFSEFLNLNYPNQPLITDYRREPQILSLPQYPHMFFEEPLSKEYSKEDNSVKPYRIQAKSIIRQQAYQPTEVITERSSSVFSNVKLPGVDEIINAILPPKSNYKVTFKISPKNTSDIHSGFKEVHTSVNKSYDRNGMRYFSLLNVSQFSKVENVNESNDVPERRKNAAMTPINKALIEKERQIQTLFELHKKRIESQLDDLKKEKYYIENVLDRATIKMQTSENLNELANEMTGLRNNVVVTDAPAVYTVTQRTVTTEKRPDTERRILINSIKTNQQTTKEILNKIDVNTDLLRQFLHKLSTLHTISTTTEHLDRNYDHHTDSRSSSHNNLALPQNFPKGTIKNKLKQVSTQKPDPNIPNIPIRRNQSKFFFDDLEDYNSVSATIKINTTHL